MKLSTDLASEVICHTSLLVNRTDNPPLEREMSMHKLLELCEAAAPYLSELPDIREHLLLTTFKKEWNPEEELQFELDSIAAELRLTRCGESTLVLYDLLEGTSYLENYQASKRTEVLDTFLFKYPLLVWILVTAHGKTADVYKHNNFIFYVAARLSANSHWRLKIRGVSAGAPRIRSCNMSRACAKYVLWGHIVYLPGEKVDPVDQAVGMRLFGSFAKEDANLGRVSDALPLSVLLSYTASWDIVAAELPDSIGAQLIKTALQKECGFQYIEYYDAESVAYLARINHSFFITAYIRYIAQIDELAPAVPDRIARVFSYLSSDSQALAYARYSISTHPWTLSPTKMGKTLSLLCSGQKVPDVRNYPEDWLELSESESLLFFARQALNKSLRKAQYRTKMLVWAVLCFLRPADVSLIAEDPEYKERLQRAACQQVADQELVSQLPLTALFSCAWISACPAITSENSSILEAHVSELSKAGILYPHLCNRLYKCVHYKGQLSAGFYSSMLAFDPSVKRRLLEDAGNHSSMVRILLGELKVDISDEDPLLLVGKAYIEYFDRQYTD